MQRASLLAGLQSFVDRIHRRGAARSAGLADFLDTAESYIEPSLRYDPKNDDITRVYETTGLFVPGTGESVSVVVRVGLRDRAPPDGWWPALHGTDFENMNDILENGLQPSVGIYGENIHATAAAPLALQYAHHSHHGRMLGSKREVAVGTREQLYDVAVVLECALKDDKVEIRKNTFHAISGAFLQAENQMLEWLVPDAEDCVVFNVLFFFVERKMEDRDKRKRQKELAELPKQPRKLRRRGR